MAQANVADLERELAAAYTSLNAGDYSGYRRYAPLIALFSDDSSRIEAAQGGSRAVRLYAAIRTCFFVDGVLVAAPSASPCRDYSVANLLERKPDLKRPAEARGVIAFASEPSSFLGRGLRSYVNLCLASSRCSAAELVYHLVLIDAFGNAPDVRVLLLGVKRYVDGESSESGLETAVQAFFARSPHWQALSAQIRQLTSAERTGLVKSTAQKLSEIIALDGVDAPTMLFELLDRALHRTEG